MAFKRSKNRKAGRKSAAKELAPRAKTTTQSVPVRRPATLDPMREIARLRRDMARVFEDFGSPLGSRFGLTLPTLSLESELPTLDVYQENDKVVVKAELPGVEKKDVDVLIDGDLLTVRGEKHKEEDVHDGDYSRKERSYGLLSRTVRLPTDVDADKATATFKNGVLQMQLPKSEAAKQRSRSIKVQ